LALDRRTTPVRTIAHWMPATKRALSDAGQIRGLIDQFLRYGLQEELEDQIIIGDGLGENFTGIANVAGVQAQAWDTDLVTTLRRARTKVRLVGRRTPTAYLLHPTDVETLALMKDTTGQYYYGGFAAAGNVATVWGLPVVENEAVPVGTGYVGDFRRCVLWNREQTTVSVSDSHANFFIRNIVAILAELRAAFGILQPTAIVEMDLTA
jgi:HK97 family phage major capsid protein